MGRPKVSTFIILLILWCSQVTAQPLRTDPGDSLRKAWTDISKISMAIHLSKKISVCFVEPGTSIPSKYSTLNFNDNLQNNFVPDRLVTKHAVIQFRIANSADTARSIWFFPGFYYWNVQLFRADSSGLVPIPSRAPNLKDSVSYRLIRLEAHDSMTVVAEMSFARTYLNTIRPRLIHPDYLNAFMVGIRVSRDDPNLITFLFCGLLLMMILYSLANYFQGANKEFLYYSGYAFFLGLMLFLKAVYSFRTTNLSLWQEEYLDFIMQDIGYLFYMIFMQRYLGTRENHPFLHRLYNAGIIMLLLSVTAYTFFHYFTDNFVAENAVENFTKYLLLLMTVIFLVYGIFRWKDRLLRYLFWGNLCLFAFSMISQLSIIGHGLLTKLPGVMSSSLFYYEIGLFLELVFFLMALNHKNRKQLIAQARERERLRADNQMKEYEKELAVFKAQQQERERISADIHDELGSGMTAIRLMSEIARNKMKEGTPVEIDKISHSADEVLNKMNAIIWSMNSGNDTLDNLVSYIRAYALEYFESTPIECRVETPENISPMELSGDKRRNIFLCIKETLNNALKHSKATLIRIDFEISQDLVIRISDNGIGIDMNNIRQFGNGLKNISRRMESIGGTYEIESREGTVTTLVLPLG